MPAATSTKPRTAAEERLLQRREAILDMAIRLFARHGFADLDMQVLADALEVGKGTLYRHYGSKEKLFLAAADRVMRDLQERIDASIDGVEDPLDRIRLGIHAYLEYFHDRPEAVEMLILERAQFKDRKRPTYFEYRERVIERWHAIYRDLIAQGRVRNVPVERLTELIGNLLYGTMFVQHIARRDRPVDQVAEDIVTVLFHGILTDPERQRQAQKRRAT